MNVLNYEQFLKNKEKGYLLVDVRTPKEFEEEGIPGAINIPLLLDEERVQIGTTYKQVSPEKAKEEGIEAIAKRLPELFREVQKVASQCRRIVFYCARGGMRSTSMAALFTALGYKCSKLEGGYRGYRQYILSEIPKLNEGIKYIVLHGKTGVRKTKLLNILEEQGFNVLNLEKLADHKGSFYGGLGQKRKQSQKRFESLIFEALFAKPTYLFVESESKRIGDLYLPDTIYDSIMNGQHLLIEASLEQRVETIMEDYANSTKEELVECTKKLQRYMNKKTVASYLDMIEKGNLSELAKMIMEEYYDPLYLKSIEKYTFDATIHSENLEVALEQLKFILGS
jgi:tRNA 2-selenouridine synthase